MHTERLDADWIVRFVRFHGMRSRNDLVPAEPKIKAFRSGRGGMARSTCPMRWLGNTLMPPRHGVGRLVPALTLPVDSPAGLIRRHHSDPSVINKASGVAVRCTGLTKHIRPYRSSCLRHPPASTRHRPPHHSAPAGAQRRGHRHDRPHILQQGGQGVPSPLDDLGV
jgi:hypothetical protein